MISGDFGPTAVALLTVAATVAVACLARQAILRRRAALRVARWKREFIDVRQSGGPPDHSHRDER